MEGTTATMREVAVPASIFVMLRRALTAEAGAFPTIHALHAAGHAAGTAAAEALRAAEGGDLATLSAPSFWAKLSTFLARRGWGTLQHSAAHDAVGLLRSADWVESAGAEVDPEGSCSFTTGFLSGFLSAMAGGPVAVLETECRGRGDDACTFVFGSEAVVHAVYGDLLEGADLNGALARL